MFIDMVTIYEIVTSLKSQILEMGYVCDTRVYYIRPGKRRIKKYGF